MKDFRCRACRRLQFKYTLSESTKVLIEVKCRDCNAFSYFTIWLDKLLSGQVRTITEDRK